MTARRWLAGVIVALGLTACTSSTAQGNGDHGAPAVLPARVPASQALTALQQLNGGTAIRPLPGSVQSGLFPDAYTVAKSCAAVRAAYRAPGAPLPKGAKVRPGPGGALLVVDSFGDEEGIVVAAQPKQSCEYALVRQPTVQVTGRRPLPPGSAWGPVGCAPPGTGYPKGIAAVSFTAGGKPWTVFVAPMNSSASTSAQASKYVAQIAQATLAQIKAAAQNGGSPGRPYPAAVQNDHGVLTVRLSGAGAGQAIVLTCTIEFGKLANFFGPGG